MRIVYLNPLGSVGGAERVLLAVMAGVLRADPSLEAYLIASTDGPLLRRAEEIGVRPVLLPMPQRLAEVGDTKHRDSSWWARAHSLLREVVMAPEVCRYRCRLQATLRDIAPDFIHSNGIKSHLLVRLAGTAPVIWHVHDFFSHRPLVRRLLRWARKGVAGAITISEAVDRDMKLLLPGLPTRVVPNVIDVDIFSPAPADPGLLDRLAGLPAAREGTVRVGLVATYARWKGHDVFLKAAAHLLQQWPGTAVRFYIIGGPIYHTQGSQVTVAELRALAHSLSLQAHVGFIDFQPEPADVYRSLDVVVHASTRPEPFGLTIIEAMACARAVIVSRAGGAAELFTHDLNAVGVTPGDVAGLAQAIKSLVGDARRRQQLAEQARLTAVRQFNPSRLGPQIYEAYRAFLGTNSRETSSQDNATRIKGASPWELEAREARERFPRSCGEQVKADFRDA
jgi:glycosyltransferase involved in cell wall biosynthesis